MKVGPLETSLDDLYQHVAALARKLDISAADLVEAARETEKNYQFLRDCQAHEQQLNDALAAKVSDETKAEPNKPNKNNNE